MGSETMTENPRIDRVVRKLWAGIEEFRKHDPTMPSQMISAFLLVAMNEGTLVLDVQNKLGLADSSTSRNIEKLSTVKTKDGERGLGLIEYRDDLDDRRKKHMYVTPKGARLLTKIMEVSA